MCKGELNLARFNLRYQTGDYIPLRLWHNKLPDNVRIEENTKGIKTRGEQKEINVNNLVCSDKVIKRGWKFKWKPQRFKKENGFLWGRVPEDRIGVYHFSDNNKPFLTVCSKRIELSNKFLQGLGLLEGEIIRSKNEKSGQYLSFSNMKPELVNLTVKALNQIGIYLERMRVQPIVNTKADEVSEHEVIDYWTDKTSFSEQHFVSVYKDSRYNTEAKYGSINLKVYDKIMRNILENILTEIKTSKNKEQIKGFLKGLFAAEGSVNLSPQNRVNYISLGVKDPQLRTEYEEMLRKIGIEPGGKIDPVSNEEARKKGWSRGSGGFFMIQGIENFRRFIEYDLLTLYPKKQLLLLIGLRNKPSLDEDLENKVYERLEHLKTEFSELYDKIQERIYSLTERDREVLNLIEELEKADRSQIADRLDINPSSASRRMRSLYQKGKIERNRHGRKIIWSLDQDQ